MVALVNKIELVSKRFISVLLPTWLKVNGIDCLLKKDAAIPSTETSVYGTYAGADPTSISQPIRVLMSGLQWRIVNDFDGGWLDDPGFIYTTYNVEDGDCLIIVRDDGRETSFKVINTQVLGTTTEVAKKFKLTNLGDLI